MSDLRFADPALEYPVTIEDGAVECVKIVAVAGLHNDWAAYVGPAHWHVQRLVDWATKLDQATAEALFYNMAHSGRSWRH